MRRTATALIAALVLLLPGAFLLQQAPQGAQVAPNPGYGQAQPAVNAQPAGQLLNVTEAGLVSSPATYGTEIVFYAIHGLLPGTAIGSNTTGIIDSAGSYISCSNQQYVVSANGTVSALGVRTLGNASAGPFTLEGAAGSELFQVRYAGIASDSAAGSGQLFIYPSMQSATGEVTVFGADFQQYQKVGYPIVGNQSFASAGQAVSDANGAFTFKFQLSDMPSGTYIVRMSGAIQATVPLVISPALQLIPDSGHVGQSVVAKLTGFASRATVAVSWGSGQAMSARASMSGTAMVIVRVPGLSYGPHIVYANSSGLGAETTFTLNTSSVVLSKYGASPGSTVYAYAEGFAPSAEVHLLYQGRVSGVAERTLGNGTAVIPFVVPEMTAGTYSMQASSTDGMLSNVTVFVVKPTILSSAESLHVGAAVQISGRFYYPLTGIKVYVGNTIVPDAFKSNENGTFYANITIPAVPGGQVALGAYDLEGNNATLFMLNIMPEIYLNTHSGSAGSRVTVTGYGFTAGRDVTILWNGNPVQAASSVGANGTFTATLAVPSGVPGTYLVTVANSTAEPIVFNLVQYTGFEAVLPAILLPLVTAIGISLYLFRKFRVRRPDK